MPYAMRLSGRLTSISDGVSRRVETGLLEGARVESELLFADSSAFREQGRLSFGSGAEIRFRTLGTGHLSPATGEPVRHGTVTWELDGGTGRFEQAAGRITSNFTVAADGQIEDEQVGLVFLPQRPQTEGARP